MQLQSLTPIRPIEPLGVFEKPAKAAGAPGTEIPFRSLFEDAVQNVKDTDAAKNVEIYRLATGQTDDLHAYGIASSKASMSIDLLTTLRNKVLDAYNEVMRIGV